MEIMTCAQQIKQTGMLFFRKELVRFIMGKYPVVVFAVKLIVIFHRSFTLYLIFPGSNSPY